MKIKPLCILLLYLCTLTTWGAGISEHRHDILLSDDWSLRPISDPTPAAKSVPVTLPHTWNATYAKGTTHYNRETMVYQRSLQVTPQMSEGRLFLYFEGVNSVADVFVNRKTVGQHKGGYTAFCIEITDHVHVGDNAIEVWASNAFRTDVLPISGDFNVYGGIHRPVHLLATGKDCISPLFYGSPGILVHQRKVSEAQAEITVETILSLKSGKQGLQLYATVTDQQGKVVASGEVDVNSECINLPMTITKPTLWNGRQNPYLYTVKVELKDGQQVLDSQAVQTGREVARHQIETAGKAVRLNIEAENIEWKADGMDLLYLNVTATDSKGRIVPSFAEPLTVTVSGPATILALDNGDHYTDELFRDVTTKRMRGGRMQVILRSQRKAGQVSITTATAKMKKTYKTENRW